jgi:hypothetical protein
VQYNTAGFIFLPGRATRSPASRRARNGSHGRGVFGIRLILIPILIGHPCLSFKLGTWEAKCPGTGSGTEIIPGKNSDTRIKPLPFTNGHGRYITVTTERTPVSVGEWPLHITVINLYYNRFTSETVTAVRK